LEENVEPEPQIRIHFEGMWSHIDKHVLVHDAKVNYMIKDALRRRGLLRSDLEHIPETAGKRDFHVVDKHAAGLILSLLADSLARRHRLRTITDEPLGYTLNSLNARHFADHRAAEASLASAIISTDIPKTVGLLTAEQYVELRKRFEEVGIPFQRAVRDLCDDHRLYNLRGEAELSEAISDIAEDYRKAVDRFRNSSFASTLMAWTPFSIGTLGGTLGLTGNSALGAIGFGLGVAVQLFEKCRMAKPEDSVGRSQRLISGLRQELLNPRLVNKLAGAL
jgi:hypothetical protein